jgi:hypothetical protein
LIQLIGRQGLANDGDLGVNLVKVLQDTVQDFGFGRAPAMPEQNFTFAAERGAGAALATCQQ